MKKESRITRAIAIAALAVSMVGSASTSSASFTEDLAQVNERIGGDCNTVIGVNNNTTGNFDLTPNGDSSTYRVSGQATEAIIRVTVIEATGTGYLQASEFGIDKSYGNVSYLNYASSAQPHAGTTFTVDLDDSQRFKLRASAKINRACVDVLAYRV